jgi:hypothetical protein
LHSSFAASIREQFAVSAPIPTLVMYSWPFYAFG